MPRFNIAWLFGLLLDWVLNFMAWFGEVCNLVIWRVLLFDCSSAGHGFAVPVSPLEVCYDTWRAHEKACLLPFLYSLLTSWFFQLCTGKKASLWSFYKGPSSPPFPQPELLSIISSGGIVLYSLKISWSLSNYRRSHGLVSKLDSPFLIDEMANNVYSKCCDALDHIQVSPYFPVTGLWPNDFGLLGLSLCWLPCRLFAWGIALLLPDVLLGCLPFCACCALFLLCAVLLLLWALLGRLVFLSHSKCNVGITSVNLIPLFLTH